MTRLSTLLYRVGSDPWLFLSGVVLAHAIYTLDVVVVDNTHEHPLTRLIQGLGYLLIAIGMAALSWEVKRIEETAKLLASEHDAREQNADPVEAAILPARRRLLYRAMCLITGLLVICSTYMCREPKSHQNPSPGARSNHQVLSQSPSRAVWPTPRSSPVRR